jgi:cation diffusion facilitator family transporter
LREYSITPFLTFPKHNLPPIKALEKSKDSKDVREFRQKEALKATVIGGFANIGLAISKGLLGYAVGSTGLIADAANSSGDVLTDVVVYFSVIHARKTATPERPWGLGKMEPLGALTVGGVLLATGCGIAYSSLASLIEVANAISISDEIIQEFSFSNFTLMEASAIGICALSIVIKEMLFRYTLNKGSAANSAVVIANAWQHRADAFVSASVMCGLSFGLVGYPMMDPLAGLLVSTLIAKQGFATAFEALKDLSDVPISNEETMELRDTALTVKGVVGVEHIRGRKSGPYVFVECTVDVPGNISASAAHRVAELVKLKLMDTHNGRVADVVVHANPVGAAGLGQMAPKSMRDHDDVVDKVTNAIMDIQKLVKEAKESNGTYEKEVLESMNDVIENSTLLVANKKFKRHQLVQSVSDVQVYYNNDGHISVKVDVVMHPQLTIAQAHVLSKILKRHILQTVPGITQADVDLELFEDGQGDVDDWDDAQSDVPEKDRASPPSS